MSKKRPVLSNSRKDAPVGHKQDIRGSQCIDREIAQSGRCIEDDHIIGL